MKMLTDLLGRSLQVSSVTLIGIFCLPYLTFAIEPIGIDRDAAPKVPRLSFQRNLLAGSSDTHSGC